MGDRGKTAYTLAGFAAILFWSTSVPLARGVSEKLGHLHAAALIQLIGGLLGLLLTTFGAEVGPLTADCRLGHWLPTFDTIDQLFSKCGRGWCANLNLEDGIGARVLPKAHVIAVEKRHGLLRWARQPA